MTGCWSAPSPPTLTNYIVTGDLTGRNGQHSPWPGVAAHADYIVTGDRKHLLPPGTFRGIAIISAADFLALMPEP